MPADCLTRPSDSPSLAAARRPPAPPQCPTGSYARRRTYRSVAYGTWKVGGARSSFLSASRSDYALADVAMAEGAAAASARQSDERHDSGVWSACSASQSSAPTPLAARVDSRSASCASTDGGSDCFTANDYCNFRSLRSARHARATTCSSDVGDGHASATDLSHVLYSFSDLRQTAAESDCEERFTSPLPFGHKRSRSAGTAALLGIRAESSAPRKRSFANLSAVAATRKLLRRLYHGDDTKDLSKRLDVNHNDAPAEHFYTNVRMSESDALAGDEPLCNGVARQANFSSWNDAYQHLKLELSTIRRRDFAILRDLQNVEQQMRGIKTGQCNEPSPIVELPPKLELAFSSRTPLSMPNCDLEHVH